MLAKINEKVIVMHLRKHSTYVHTHARPNRARWSVKINTNRDKFKSNDGIAISVPTKTINRRLCLDFVWKIFKCLTMTLGMCEILEMLIGVVP